MKKIVIILLIALSFLYLSVPTFAYQISEKEELFAPDILSEPADLILSPMSGDIIDIIIMCLCISGCGLVILVVLTIISKNKK